MTITLRHIVVATDESAAGRSAARMGYELLRNGDVRHLVFVSVDDRRPDGLASGDVSRGATARRHPMFADLVRWLDAQPPLPAGRTIEFRVGYGIPSIEICRAAEACEGDLLVLGRKPHTPANRLLIGDTADAVARRSVIPTLHVPAGAPRPRSMLVAVKGNLRTPVVLRACQALANCLTLDVSAVIVEAARPDEAPALAARIPAAGSAWLVDLLRDSPQPGAPGAIGHVEIRRGDPVEQILDTVKTRAPDILAFGYHRGGPPGMIEAGSVARRLAHSAPCALLVVPL